VACLRMVVGWGSGCGCEDPGEKRDCKTDVAQQREGRMIMEWGSGVRESGCEDPGEKRDCKTDVAQQQAGCGVSGGRGMEARLRG
jgi:hypothetical protein